jgi:nitrate/nitrite transporter NarK
MNMLGNLGGALNGVAVGWIYQGTGSWEFGLWSIAAAYALAAVLWLRVSSVTESEK